MRLAFPLLVVALLVLGVAAAAAADLSPGDPAPPFRLAGSDGKTYALGDFVGQRELVLAWFPKAFTPG